MFRKHDMWAPPKLAEVIFVSVSLIYTVNKLGTYYVNIVVLQEAFVSFLSELQVAHQPLVAIV